MPTRLLHRWSLVGAGVSWELLRVVYLISSVQCVRIARIPLGHGHLCVLHIVSHTVWGLKHGLHGMPGACNSCIYCVLLEGSEHCKATCPNTVTVVLQV